MALLLDQALHYLFQVLQLEEISLCVDQDNAGALQLYHRAGFETVRHTYWSEHNGFHRPAHA